jgi:hypothetical protein
MQSYDRIFYSYVNYSDLKIVQFSLPTIGTQSVVDQALDQGLN